MNLCTYTTHYKHEQRKHTGKTEGNLKFVIYSELWEKLRPGMEVFWTARATASASTEEKRKGIHLQSNIHEGIVQQFKKLKMFKKFFNSFDLILLKVIQLSSIQLWSQVAPTTVQPQCASQVPFPVVWVERSLVTLSSPLLIWLRTPEESSLWIVLPSWTRRRDRASLGNTRILWPFSEWVRWALGMEMLGRCQMNTMLVFPLSFFHRFVGGVDLLRRICRVFKATCPRCTNIPVLSDITFLQVFNVVLPFYAMPPAAVEQFNCIIWPHAFYINQISANEVASPI